MITPNDLVTPDQIESLENYAHMRCMTVEDYMRFFNKPYVAIWFIGERASLILAKHTEEHLPHYGKNEKYPHSTGKGVVYYAAYDTTNEPLFAGLYTMCLVNTGGVLQALED